MFMHHPSLNQLADYIAGDLPLDQRAELEAHLFACSQCSGDLAKLKRLILLIRNSSSEDAPRSVIQRAIDLFQSRSMPAPSGWRSRILALLYFDSAGLAPAFGVRSARPGSRQLLFSAGADEIDLRIEPEGEAWIVSGQVLGDAAASGMAVLHGAAGTSEANFNELSEFVLPSVQAGTYKLTLNLANADVEIDELRIGL